MSEHSEEIKGESPDTPERNELITKESNDNFHGVELESSINQINPIERKLDLLTAISASNFEKSLNIMELFSNRLEHLEKRLTFLESKQSVVVNENGKLTDNSKEKEKKSEKKDKNKDKDKKDKGNGGDEDDMSPRKVGVSYKINCLSEINPILSTFKVDVKIFYTWNDPKLVGRSSISDAEYESDKKLFHPDVNVTNGHDLETVSKTVKITDSKTGELKVTAHYIGTLYMTSMDLKLFPFDCQNLQIQLKPYKMPIEDVVLYPKPAIECCLEHHVTHEWNLSGHCMKVYETDVHASSVGKKYSTLYITVLTQRRPNWFLANIFMPSLLLSLLSLLVYTIDAEHVGERNELALATLMALIANKNIVSSHMPNVDYHTMVDLYLDCCFLLQVLTLFTNCFLKYLEWIEDIIRFATPKWTHPLISLNFMFLLLQVFLFLLLHLWIFLTLSEHKEHVDEWISQAEEKSKSSEATPKPVLSKSLSDHYSESKMKPIKSIDILNGVPPIVYNKSILCGVNVPSETPKSKKKVTIFTDLNTTDFSPVDFTAANSVSSSPTNSNLRKSFDSLQKSKSELFISTSESPYNQISKTRSDMFISTSQLTTPRTDGIRNRPPSKRDPLGQCLKVLENTLSKEVIIKLRNFFPSMIIKDDKHFTNYGASTLIPVTSIVNILEEKKYVKQMKHLREKISSTVEEEVGLRLKNIYAGNKLKAIRATGDRDALMNASALVLQTLFRTKITRRNLIQQKKDLNQNILETYARKIQNLFRHRQLMKRFKGKRQEISASSP